MSSKTLDNLLTTELKRKVGKYFEFLPIHLKNINCENLCQIYDLLYRKFSDHEMKLLLGKAFEMKDKRFFKSLVSKYNVKEVVFINNPHPILLKIGDKDINLLLWVVDNVEFKSVNKYVKSELFSSILHNSKNIDPLKNIIRKLNISIRDINYIDYVFYISNKNVEIAFELINLFGEPVKPGLYEHILQHAIQEKNYPLAIYIIENHKLNYDIFQEIQKNVFSMLINDENTADTDYIIDLVLENLEKDYDEIIRDCMRIDGINPFWQGDESQQSDQEDFEFY